MTNVTPQIPKAQPPYWQATGKMPYSLTNDYLFRALLQKNNRVLKHLICSLLHLQPEEVSTVTIENPIVLGQALDAKTFILDIRVLLDNHTLINLEMQIVNYLNWPERSLSVIPVPQFRPTAERTGLPGSQAGHTYRIFGFYVVP